MTYRDPKTGRWAVHPFEGNGGGLSHPLQPEAKTLVFVYGTLKRGFPNHGLLKAASFIGEATTMDAWRMHAGGFPAVLPVRSECDERECCTIKGELFCVDAETLRRLDRLEGYRPDDPYGSMYRRETVSVSSCLGVSAVQMYVGHERFESMRPYTDRDASGAICWTPSYMRTRGADNGRTEQQDC